jgi:hypothetical protein
MMPAMKRDYAWVRSAFVGLACFGACGGDTKNGSTLPVDAAITWDAVAGAPDMTPIRVATGAYAAVVLADKPILYLRLDDPTGDVATDAAGRATMARYQGGGLQRGVPGALGNDDNKAIRLNGETGWVNLGDNFDFVGRVPFSIELWVKPRVIDEKFRGLFTKETNEGGRQGYLLVLNQGVGLTFDRARGGVVAQVATKPISATAWSHVVVTFDGMNLRLYVNGQAAAGPTPAGLELPDTSVAAVAGARVGGNTPIGQAAHFDGDLDEVAVYDLALSADRVAAHHQAGRGN